jgi:hypothetical protein
MLEEAEMERRKRLLENDLLLEEERQLIIEESEARITEIKQSEEEKRRQEAIKSAEEEAMVNEQVASAKADIANQGLELIQEVAGKESKIGKAAGIAQATINTAQGVTKALASSPPPFNLILAGITGAAGLVQINKIAQFEEGGRIGGKRHSQGGTFIEAEVDEFVMSRKATSKYGFDFMDKINNLELNELTPVAPKTSINVIDTKGGRN